MIEVFLAGIVVVCAVLVIWSNERIKRSNDELSVLIRAKNVADELHVKRLCQVLGLDEEWRPKMVADAEPAPALRLVGDDENGGDAA